MGKSVPASPPWYALPALLSLDTALLLVLWLAFFEALGLVVLTRSHYWLSFLFCLGGAACLRLSQASLLSPAERAADPRWELIWQEYRLYIILLPAVFTSALILAFFDLGRVERWLLIPGFLLWLIYAVSRIVLRPGSEPSAFAFPKPLLIGLLFCFALGFVIWPTLSVSRLEITAALVGLSLFLGLAEGLEETPITQAKRDGRVSRFFLENLCPGWTQRIPTGLVFLAGLSLIASISVPTGPLSILFSALAGAGFNLFLLALFRPLLNPLTVRLLSRPLMMLPTLPILLTTAWSWWEGRF